MIENEHPSEKVASKAQKTVPANVYTREYYTTCCDGYDEFNTSRGKDLPRRLSEPLKLLTARRGSVILDIGCGRGELIYRLVQEGHQAIGLDYAAQGVKIAHNAVQEFGLDKAEVKLALLLSNAKQLSFPDRSIDHIFMLDVVEHLYPDELEMVFSESYRVLKPGGKLIIHTMPNTWYYAVGYPAYRLVQRLRGIRLPTDPRARWTYGEVHVNEQSPIRLSRALRGAQFDTRVWLTSIQDYHYERNQLVRFGMRFLTSVHPFKLVFCNDIFAVATKPATGS